MPEQRAAIAELRALQRKRVAAIRRLNGRYAGRAFPKRAAEKWNRLSRELDETQELITELRARCERDHRGLDDCDGRGGTSGRGTPFGRDAPAS